MLFCPNKYVKDFAKVNDEMKLLSGELDDKEAKITLAKFLRYNLGFTTELISGFRPLPYQEIMLKAMFNRNFSMFVASRGAAKTLSYDDNSWLIEKETGYTAINNIFKDVDFSKGDRWEDVLEVNLWNGEAWQTVNKIYIQPQKKCLKITTYSGYYLVGSTNHLIKIINPKTLDIEWTRFSDIKNGDYACIDRSKPSWGYNCDNDESYLVGLLIGDGCYSPKQTYISLTSADEEILNFCKQFTTLKPQSKKGSKAIDIRFRVDFSNYLINKYGITKTLSYDKLIPPGILSSKDMVKRCISGLFDTDGTVGEHCISITSTSQKLINQIQSLLLTFGIISRIKLQKTKSKFGKAWRLSISGINLQIFKDEIDFTLSRKSDSLSRLLGKKYNTNIDIIPGVIEMANKIKTESNRYWKGLGHKQLSKKNFNQMNASYNLLNNYIQAFNEMYIDNDDFTKLKNIQKTNYFYDKIISIEEVTTDCIDLNVPDGERYWANGFINHNSSIAAIACFLIPIFYPNSNILVAGPTFRTARNIFSNLEKIISSPEAQMLQECFAETPSKRNDLFEWRINGGTVRAIPLNGEKIRGFRASTLILDEFLLLSEDIVQHVLMPFLIAPNDIKIRMETTEREDELIKQGKMTEEQRTVFPNSSKMICLTSASYTFENAYKVYSEWYEKIYDPNPVKDATYFVSNISWEALPPLMVEKSVIEEARSGGDQNAAFLREYGARFVDGSDSYFSAKKMHELTIKDGDKPTVLLDGNPSRKYLLAIDPSWSSSPSSDFFAMAVGEINEDNNTITVVHNYAVAGGELKDHIKYFYYLLKAFNIELVVADNSDGNFIKSANESVLFQNNNVNIQEFEYDGDLINQDFQEMLKKAKRDYNKTANRICFKRIFSNDTNRRMNEQLQMFINTKRVWFASKLTPNDDEYENAMAKKLPYEPAKVTGEWMDDLISTQDDLIYQVKKQCSLIEVGTSPLGKQTFDLPQSLKRNKSANRARRDNYTALLLLCEAFQAYNNIMKAPAQEKTSMFIPRLIGNSSLG